MQKLIFTNVRGESVELGNTKPYILSHIDGAGGVESDIKTTRSPYQDGSTYIRTQLEDRLLTITGAVMGKSREEMYELRNQLARILNAKLGPGRLEYINDAKVYSIQAVPDGSPIWGDRYANNQLFTAAFLCPDPYWNDEFESAIDLKYFSGGLTFPLVLPTTFTLIGFKNVFVNAGDVETPVLIRYYGPAVNPVVENETTGEYIRVNYSLSDTDVLEINTAFGRKRVEVVAEDGSRTNVFHWIDLNSTFFNLQPGDNVLSYSSDIQNIDKAKVTVTWQNRYSGA